MKTSIKVATGLLASFVVAASAQAATILFDIAGKGGAGLLKANEAPNPTTVGGSGGEVGPGISFDTVTNILTINIGWGSGNGFTDLSSAITGAHVHVPTPSAPPASFNESTVVLVGFNTAPGFNSSITNGGFSGTVTIPAANVAGLLEGRSYLNIHTNTNPGGEIRGNLLQVPEPATTALLGLGCAAAGLRRRRRC